VATHNQNVTILPLAIALEAKENLGVDTLLFWWIKATIMEGNCPMHKQ
jgi:hypothetical protein